MSNLALLLLLATFCVWPSLGKAGSTQPLCRESEKQIATDPWLRKAIHAAYPGSQSERTDNCVFPYAALASDRRNQPTSRRQLSDQVPATTDKDVVGNPSHWPVRGMQQVPPLRATGAAGATRGATIAWLACSYRGGAPLRAANPRCPSVFMEKGGRGAIAHGAGLIVPSAEMNHVGAPTRFRAIDSAKINYLRGHLAEYEL